jgi:tetratricopeptide (TPR) repeat protein
MKNSIFIIVLPVIAFVFSFCTSQPSTTPAASGLLSLDEAIESSAIAIESRITGGSEIAVYKIAAPDDKIGEYLAEGLNDKISMRGKLHPLAREVALVYAEAEHQFQMSGLVSDESAVGIGHYLGAKVVVSGTFSRFADFSQFRIRAVDVLTSSLLVSHTVRINNNDRILANISEQFSVMQAPRITENALDYLNRGKDLFAEGKFNKAIAEFDKALAINRDLSEAYFLRAYSYVEIGEYDMAIVDLTQAIRIDPNFSNAYSERGFAYYHKGNYDDALEDYNSAIRTNPNNSVAYNNRGSWYSMIMENYDRAIADYNQAIRLNSNYKNAYSNRGDVYIQTGNYDLAISDFNQALEIDSNFVPAYYNRGRAFFNKGDYDRAIADFEVVLHLDPSHPYIRNAIDATRQQRRR